MWEARFGGSRSVLGQTVVLNGLSYEIVGVAPPGFSYPSGAQLWIPRALDHAGCARGCHTFQAVGRLAAGATLDAAAAELATLGRALEERHPTTNTGKRFLVRDLKDALTGDVREGVWLMFGASVLVLLIASANVANLLLARASAREGEFAVRAALGASRGRLATHVLAEALVLAMAGGAFGLGLAFAGVAAFRRLAEGTIPRADTITVDGTVLLVSLLCLLLVLAVFALIPALTASRPSVTGGLSSVGRGGATTARTIRFRRALLAAEVALSASLLIGAGLLVRTFAELHATNIGFETHEVTRFSVVLPDTRYPELERGMLFFQSLEEQIAALPGVEAVGTMYGAPLGRGQASGGVRVEGRPDPANGEGTTASVRPVTPGLMPALRIPLRRGRLFTASDNRRDAEPVALVNEAFVRQNFANEDPIGGRVRVTVNMGYGSPQFRIIGVVGDVRFNGIIDDAGADIYMPHAQFGPLSMTVHVRTAPGAPPVTDAVRAIVSRLDPSVPVYRVETLEQVVSRLTAPTRLYLALVGLFALIAALLAAIGLYGVVSYVVLQRRREIGIRVALGAPRRGIIALVVRQGMQPALLGLAVGIAMALAAGRYLESMLYGVRPHDPLVVGLAATLMAGVALFATLIPAVGASGANPARALHDDAS
jgi:putative ABC transport system permease protein